MSHALALSVLLSAYAASETLSLGLERLIIKDPQLPAAFDRLRVIFISDIHHGLFSSQRRLRQMVTRINRLQPDLILLGGDYLQTRHRSLSALRTDYQQLARILARLHPTSLGKFAVLGNHDYVFDEATNRDFLAQAGFKLLVNQGVDLPRGDAVIRLDGVGDLWYGQPNFVRAHAHTPAAVFTILLSHQPNFIDQLTATDGVNFVLAGHTHGAHIRPFNFFPVIPRRIARWEYTVGLIETSAARMLVSPGIGNEIPYFRFFSPPKIHLLTFKSAPHVRA